MNRLLTFLLTALLAFSVGWAETTYSYTFESKQFSANETKTLGGIDWTLAGNGGYWGYDGTKGQQFGSGSSPYKSLTLSTSGIPGTITSITVNASTASSATATLNVTVGGTSYISHALTTSATNYTGSGSSSGEVVIAITQTTAKALYIKSISVTYEEGGVTPAEPNLYRKVTGTSDLVVGKSYIFVNENGTSSAAMGAINSSHNGTGVTGLTVDSENKIDIGGKDVVEFTLGGVSDAWTFAFPNGTYLGVYNTSSGGFYAHSNTNTNETKWTVSDAGRVRFSANAQYYIRYNTSGSQFVCSSSSSGTTVVQLYVKDEGTTPVTVSAPVFSINGTPVTGTQAVDNGTVVDITADSGNYLSYTTDGTDPANSGTATITSGNTAQVTITEGCTIRAIALDDDFNESEETSLTLTVNAPVAQNIYKKVTGDADLVAGKTYIIVNEDKGVGMGAITQINSTYVGAAVSGLTFANNQVNIAGTNVVELTLGGNSDGWTFVYNDNYLSWSIGNTLTTSDSGNANSSKWTVASKTVGGFTGFALTNVGNTDRVLYYNSGSPRFACYTSSQSLACLYVKDSNDPTLTVTPASQTLEDIPYNAEAGASTSGTIHVTGAHLTGDVTVTYSGADFTVSPTTLSPVDGSVSQDVTVTYNGTSTEAVTCEITVTCGDLTRTVTVTAKKQTPPPATMTATPNPLSFGTIDGGTLTVNAGYLDANVNLSILNTNYSTNYDKWTVNPTSIATADGSVVEATATVNYSGRLLKSDNTVRVSTTTSGVADVDVPVHYKHNGPVYIVTSPSWDFANGIQMGYENGVYTQTLTTTSDTYLIFAKKSGGDVNWQSSYIFGPKADPSYDNPNADWWLSEGSMNRDWPLDSTIHHTVKMLGGTYTITLDPETNTMRIVPDVHDPVFSPESGRYEVAQNVEITCDTPGAHIYYTTDGSTPDTNSTQYTGPIPVTAELTTIKAIAVYGGITSTVVEATYIIKPAGSNTYVLVKDDEDIVPFEDYVLVYTRTSTNPYTYYALSNNFNSSNYYATVTNVTNGVTQFEVNDEVVTLADPTDVNVLTLENAGNDQFYIRDLSGQYLYYNSGNTVNRGTKGTTDAYKWTLSIDNSYNVVIQNVGNTGRYLQCNVSSTRYACYLSSSTMPNAKLYREGTVKVAKPVISPEGGTANKMFDDVEVTMTCSTENVTIYYTLDGSDPTQNSAVYAPDNKPVVAYGSAPVTVKAIAVDGEGNVSKVATVTYYWDRVTVAISPASQRVSAPVTVTITPTPSDATVTYTINGGEPQTYTGPFTVNVDETNHEVTVEATAVKGKSTATASATYNYKSDKVYSIAEFKELDNGEEVTFMNPVTVLFDYSQNSGSGQEYIWVKDRTGYMQLFIQPQFKSDFAARYENSDVIPPGFKVKKGYHDEGQYYQAQCFEWQDTFRDTTVTALADPEQVLLSELLENPADYNDRYLYINKLQVSNVNGLNFRIAADENGDNESEVQGGTAIVGYNKYNSPAWKNKQGEVIGVTLPTDNKFYNVTFIFQQWRDGYEIMPIKFTEWEDNSVRLEDLVQIGEEGNPYTISNQLIAAHVTWDDNKGKFAIFAKDDEMYAAKRYPAEGQKNYLIEFENQNGTFVNTVEQKDYDQSNWIEILIPNSITDKTAVDVNVYQRVLGELKDTYENKILDAGSVSGTYVDALNPTIDMGNNLPELQEVGSAYTPNIYCTANFLAENIDADGAMSYRTDELGGEYFFFMDAKPQEFCQVVWAYYTRVDSFFVAPAQEGNQINGHRFKGSFAANMSLCEDYDVTKDTRVLDCFTASNTTTPEKLYGFEAIVRKNPEAWSNGRHGAPRRIQPYTEEDGNLKDNPPLYIVYPLSSESSSNGTVTAVCELMNDRAVKSVSYYNLMGVESEQPFEGINIVVTRYTDGTISTAKVLR